MPKPVKPEGETPIAAAMPFEEALKRLTAIVESMDSDELPLEELLIKYEEGAQLSRICQTKLSEAELKIQQLEKNAAGQLTLKTVQIAETKNPV